MTFVLLLLGLLCPLIPGKGIKLGCLLGLVLFTTWTLALMLPRSWSEGPISEEGEREALRKAKVAIRNGSLELWIGYRDGRIVWCEKRFGIDVSHLAMASFALVPVVVFWLEWNCRETGDFY
jgi:hypothetical protein